MRRTDEQTSASEPRSGLRGEGGISRDQGRKDVIGVGKEFDVYANQITQWKSQLLEGTVWVFGGEARAESAAATVDVLASTMSLNNCSRISHAST